MRSICSMRPVRAAGRRAGAGDVNRGLVLYWRGDFGGATATLESACRALKRTATGPARCHEGHPRGGARSSSRLPRGGTPSSRGDQMSGTLGQTLIVASPRPPQSRLPGDVATRSATSDRRVRERGSRLVAAEASGYLPQVTPTMPRRSPTPGSSTTPTRSSRRSPQIFTADGNGIEIAGALCRRRRSDSPNGTTPGAGAAEDVRRVVPQAGP